MCHRNQTTDQEHDPYNSRPHDEPNSFKSDLPGKNPAPVEPLPESTRPRKDGPGGE